MSAPPLPFSLVQSQCDVGHAHPAVISPVDGESTDLASAVRSWECGCRGYTGSPIEVREWVSWPAAEPLTVQYPSAPQLMSYL